MNMTFLICGILIMLIMIAREYLKKNYNIDMDKILISKIQSI